MTALQPTRSHLRYLGALVESAFADLAGKTVILVDYPLHNNIGDWLIHHGERVLFERLGCKVERQYCHRNIDRLLQRQIPQDWVIVLHGGGNFGDIYGVHQRLRHQVIQRFCRNPIVMMPQSVHFNDPRGFEREAPIYQQHPHLTLHVRDLPSYQLLAQALAPEQVQLTPDMAMLLLDAWPWQPEGEGTLLFRRRDCEAAAPDCGHVSADGFDWDDLFTPSRKRIIRQITRLANYEQRFGLHLGAAACWQYFTWHTLKPAHQRFMAVQTVDTDRLHGMIFAMLLGKQVILRDNSYGKIQRFTDAWLNPQQLAQSASTLHNVTHAVVA